MELIVKGNNLYRNGRLIDLGGDELMLYRDKLEIKPGEQDKYYTVSTEENLTLIAYKNYRGIVADPSKYWWVIADANNIYDPMDLADYVGEQILIPNILNILALLD